MKRQLSVELPHKVFTRSCHIVTMLNGMTIGRCHQTNNPATSAIVTFFWPCRPQKCESIKYRPCMLYWKINEFCCSCHGKSSLFFCVYSFENTQRILKVLAGRLKFVTLRKHLAQFTQLLWVRSLIIKTKETSLWVFR